MSGQVAPQSDPGRGHGGGLVAVLAFLPLVAGLGASAFSWVSGWEYIPKATVVQWHADGSPSSNSDRTGLLIACIGALLLAATFAGGAALAAVRSSGRKRIVGVPILTAMSGLGSGVAVQLIAANIGFVSGGMGWILPVVGACLFGAIPLIILLRNERPSAP